jgi:adenylate cyclase
MVILFCIVVSLVVTGISFPFLNESKVFGFKMSSNAWTNTLFIIFMATFFLTAIPIARSILSKARIGSRPARPAEAPPPPPAARAHTKKKRPKADVIPSMPVTDKREKPDKKKKAEEAHEKEKLEEEEEEPEEEEKPEDALSHQAEKEKTFILKFLGEAIKNSDMKSMDNFNKFGVNLFLAGSCEAMSKDHELDEDTAALVLSESVQVVGFKKEHAESFSGKYQEYLLADSRYMQRTRMRLAMNPVPTP